MPPRTSTKRKSAAKDAVGPSKKARADSEADIEDFDLEKEDRAYTARIVNTILADPEGYELPDGDIDTQDAMICLARYARYLEEELAKAKASAPVVVAQTPEQLQAAAEKLRRSAVSGIEKQMSVRVFCDIYLSISLLTSHYGNTVISGNHLARPAVPSSPTTGSVPILKSLERSCAWMVHPSGR